MHSVNSGQKALLTCAVEERESSSSESFDGDAVKREAAALGLGKCISSWKQIFPWMHYEETTNMFVCLTCEWGSIDPNVIKIFQITSPKDVHRVAKMLKKHRESKHHQQISTKYETILKLCQYFYPLLKRFSLYSSTMAEIIGNIKVSAGGVFPGPQDPMAMHAFVGYTCKRIAEHIEEDLLNSLSESPFFSVLTHNDNEFSIVRWLNASGKSEEHLFCRHVGFPGQAMTCLDHLESRSIDLKKMVSFTVLSKTSETDANKNMPLVINSPVRCPDMGLFMGWIAEASFMKELFEHLNVLTKLCKTYFHKFALFPEASDLMRLEEPFSHNCILSRKIVAFYFENLLLLKDIAADIHKKTRNMDAYGFSSLQLKNPKAMIQCAFMFHRLQAIMKSVTSNLTSSYKELQQFNRDINARMEKPEVVTDEYAFLSLFNIFVSHVLVSLPVSGNDVVSVLSKKFDSLTEKDIELLLPNLLKEHRHLGTDCILAGLKLLQRSTGNRVCENILEALEYLSSSVELQKKFPEFFVFAQKVNVLPCFPAATEQSFFNVTSLQLSLTERASMHLRHPLSIIILEGPSCDKFSAEKVLEMWARKWKVGSSSRYDFSEKDVTYKI